MDIDIKYVVYDLNEVMGSKTHLALEEVKFSGWLSNGFKTEEDAMQALISEEKVFRDYIILKRVFLRPKF